MSWDQWPAPEGGLDLILAIAVEMISRTETRLGIYLGEAGPRLGRLETACADPYQILTFALPPEAIPKSGPLTIRLQMETAECLWLFAPDPTAANSLKYQLPRLTARCAEPEAFLARLDSMACLPSADWTKCVGISIISASNPAN